jgi:hypothetical protein
MFETVSALERFRFDNGQKLKQAFSRQQAIPLSRNHAVEKSVNHGWTDKHG